MSRSLMATCAMGGLLGLALPAPALQDDPATVAKGKDYLVHYLPPSFSGLGQCHAPRGADAAFLHTTPSTGEMKVLLKLGGDRFELLGYATDRERLYVAVKSHVLQNTPGSAGIIPPAVEYRFHIYAFWLVDGSELVHKEFKESVAPERLQKSKPVRQGGPIELTEDGSKCFGATLKFDGKKVVAPAPSK